MLNKRHNPVATFFILLTIVGVAKPAKALVEGQSDRVMTSISEAWPQQTQVKLATTDGAVVVNQSRDFTNEAFLRVSSTTQDLKSAWNRSPNRADIAEIASGAGSEKSQKFIESLDRENAIAKVNSIPALDTYTNNGDRDLNVGLNFVADTDIDNSRSLTNADENLNANFNLENSGSVNPTLEDSGSVDSNLEDSGEINFDVEDSGEIESGVNPKDSGSVESNLEDSGEIKPDLKDSGQTISFKAGDSTILAQDNTAAPNGVERDENPPTRESQWWWWLPLIIGIPVIVIAAIAVSNRQKKGDREPAIDNVRDLNTPDRGIDVSGTSGRENLSAVGANVGNVDRLDNTISTATLAEGTTTNFVGDRATAEDNIDLDIDRSDLEDPDSITEIPSTSVSEFTGYETKLQAGDNSTKLQDDDLDLESTDNIPPINPIDHVAASELVTDLEFEETTADSTIEVSELADPKLDTNTVDPLNLSIPSDRIGENTSNNIVEGDTAIKDDRVKEFRGDYVLQEETQGFTPYQQADADLDSTETAQSNELNLDSGTESSELDLSKPDVAVSELDSDIDLANEETIKVIGFDGDRTISSDEIASPAADFQPRLDTEFVDEQNNETVNELDLNPERSSELDLSKPDVAVSEVADTNIISEPQNTVELATNQETIEVIGFDSDLYLEPTQTNSDLDELDRANAQRLDDSDRLSGEATDENLTDDFEVVNITIEEIGFDDNNNQIEATIEEISFDDRQDSSLDEISFDDSQSDEISFEDNNNQIEATIEEISFDDRQNSSLEEISFDDRQNSSLDEINFEDNSNQTIEASIEEISFDDSENTSLDEISLDDSQFDEINFEDNSNQTIEASIEEISFDDSENTSLDEISLDDRQNSSLDEINFEDNSNQTIEASIEEISFDDSENTSLDEISLDDSQFDEINFEDNSNQTIDSSLEEISFDDSENTSLDEISLDDSQFDEISFEDNSNQTIDSSLDEISFDDRQDSSLDEISFDDRQDSSLDEISLDDSENTSLDEISFDDRQDSSLDEISLDDSQFDEINFEDNSNQTIEASLDEISLDDSENTSLDEISFDDRQDSSLDEISFDDSENTSLDEISFDDRQDSSLNEISLDDSQFDEINFEDNSNQTIEASIEEISFDDRQDSSLDEISLDDSQFDEINFEDNSNQTIDSSLEEISLDDSENTSLDEISFDDSENPSSNKIDDSDSDEVSYEELDKAQGDLTLDLLSNSTAGITSLSDDESEDMNNITEWLESLETPKQSTDNILEWLDSLNTDDTDSVPENSDRHRELEETNDISFQFIEDLLDDDPKQENK